MVRIARGDVPAGTYHVTHRTAGPILMFHDDVDRTDFCMRLARIIEARRWVCHAFCLMPTHYHLLLEVGDNTLQPGMQYLNGTYAQNFNRRHGRWGHLKGERYSAKPVLSDGHMLSTFRYIAQNPVAAGLCERPSEWIWGSYRDCIGLDNRFSFVTHDIIRSYFGPDPERAIPLLREFVEDLEPGSVPGRAA
jgi:putative transposase